MRAIYIDFECLKKPPTPILLGILKDLRGEQHFEQLILDDALKSVPAKPGRLRHVTVQEAAEYLIADADASGCSIVGWSLFDRDVLLNCGISEPLQASVRRLDRNALDTAKPWKTKVYPEVKIVRAGRFAPKNTLDKFAALAGYPEVVTLQGGDPAKWIRDIQKALKRDTYRRIKKTAKEKLRALLNYNEHDCRATRHVWLKASFELVTWREYERTKYCFQPDVGGPICFMVGSIDRKRDAVLDGAGLTTWAFVTAWHPGSQSAENARRQSELASAVNADGYRSIPGEGFPEDGARPPEESLFVMGISRRAARGLGRTFGQLAIVVGHKNFRGRLVRC